MRTNGKASATAANLLPKCRTGIQGLDEITGGGLPRGRPTLVCGGAGCGKTLLGAEFLVRGAVQFNEPGGVDGVRGDGGGVEGECRVTRI
jgi:circadian clock protein KaiC